MDLSQSETDNPEERLFAGPSEVKRATKQILTPRLCAVLDRCKISDRDAVHLLTACMDSLNLNAQEHIINRSSIKRGREVFREAKYSEIKSGVDVNSVVVHWDSKLLPDMKQKCNVDRLAVAATGPSFEQLLGAPQIVSSTGTEMSSAVFDTLQDWGLLQKVEAFSFDTTASNTGRLNGACTLLEQKLERSILWLPCRHHIFEIVLSGVFNATKVTPLSGPNIPIFKRFQKEWKHFDKTCFQADLEIAKKLREVSTQF